VPGGGGGDDVFSSEGRGGKGVYSKTPWRWGLSRTREGKMRLRASGGRVGPAWNIWGGNVGPWKKRKGGRSEEECP